MNEGLRPHELASQIMDVGGYEIRNGRVESERLAGLIDRSEQVWQELKSGTFEEDEFGHATIGVEDWESDYLTAAGDNVDALRVYYHDPRGNITTLGRVHRIDTKRKATATVHTSENQTEPLLPNDARWNAVVGTIERAIQQCLDEKAVSSERGVQ